MAMGSGYGAGAAHVVLRPRQFGFDQARPVARTDRKNAVVEVVARIVQEAAGFGRARTDPDIATGHPVRQEREIVGAHGGLVLGIDVVGADDRARHLRTDGDAAGIVVQRRVTALIFDFGRGAVHGGGRLRNLANSRFDQVLRRRQERASGPAHTKLVSDDVVARSAMHRCHADHGGIERRRLPAHDGLQCQHDLRGDHDKVDAEMRPRRMRSASAQHDAEIVGAGKRRTCPHGEFTGRQDWAGCACRRRRPWETFRTILRAPSRPHRRHSPQPAER